MGGHDELPGPQQADGVTTPKAQYGDSTDNGGPQGWSPDSDSGTVSKIGRLLHRYEDDGGPAAPRWSPDSDSDTVSKIGRLLGGRCSALLILQLSGGWCSEQLLKQQW